jgi:putative nucleotidyltransferase-like protein
MIRRSLLGAWLLHCADPLALKSNSPPAILTSQQAKKLVFKAETHGVLPATLRNFPFCSTPALIEVGADANSRAVVLHTLSMMLKFHSSSILAETKGLPVALVKGLVFATRIYPKPCFRPFTDIDLLASPDALSSLNSVLLDAGFRLIEDHPSHRESKWRHKGNTSLLLEVHTNLVHLPRLRRVFSLTYDDLAGDLESTSSLLTIAVMHGAMHYFALLKHVVDVCQAARALTARDEARLAGLVERTGTRLPAVVGLTLASKLFGEERCSQIALGLATSRQRLIAQSLVQPSIALATIHNRIEYNLWRRYVFRELLRAGSLQ